MKILSLFTCPVLMDSQVKFLSPQKIFLEENSDAGLW